MTSFSQAAKQPDPFLATVRKFFNELSKHPQIVTGLFLVLLVAGGAMAMKIMHQDTKSAEAREALFIADRSADKELAAITAVVQKEQDLANPPAAAKLTAAKTAKDAKKKDAADVDESSKKPPKYPASDLATYRKVDVDATFPEAIKDYKAVIASFPASRSAFEARLALGDLYFNHGAPANALGFYSEAVSSAPSPREAVLAQYSLGYSNEAAGKWNEAIQAYQAAMTGPDVGLKGDMQMAIARCYLGMGDHAKAGAIYDQVLTQLPNTPYAKSAETFKSQL